MALPDPPRPEFPRSSRAADWPVGDLLAAKGATRVSVVLPARDEAATVGTIVARIREVLVERAGVVDEVVVVDSRSVDDTAGIAAAAGARVVHQDRVLAHLAPLDGKGDALWKGLAASTGDVVVFLDADLRDFDPAFVTGLLGPLLTDPATAFVKGYYHRPGVGDDDGGRVSELVARPLLTLYWPELAGFVQPLAGEYAARRPLLERIPFVTGYGVELGMLVDVLERVGLAAMAQVDLGRRLHRHHDIETLGRMAAQVLLAAEGRRAPGAGPPSTVMTQFRRRRGPRRGGVDRGGVDRDVIVTDVTVGERPPLREVTGDRSGRARRSGAG